MSDETCCTCRQYLGNGHSPACFARLKAKLAATEQRLEQAMRVIEAADRMRAFGVNVGTADGRRYLTRSAKDYDAERSKLTATSASDLAPAETTGGKT